jgi:hypothetical protein
LRNIKPFYFAKRKLQPTATILVALAISISISARTITTFDAPGADTGPDQVWSIAPNGAVTGFFFDPQQRRSRLRARSGCGRVGLTQILPDSNSWPTDAVT